MDSLIDFKGILADFQGAVTGSDTMPPRADAFEKIALGTRTQP